MLNEEIERIKNDPNKEMAKAHLDYRDIWDKGLENYPFARSRIVPIIYEIKDGSKVLDVGCNSGEFIKYLKEKKKCDVYGVDISQQLIDTCMKKGLENVWCVDADKLPFEDNTFDVVTLMEVLEHFDDPIPCLKEIRRVLKPNGHFLGTCPHANLERYVWDDSRLHHQYYDEEKLRKDLDVHFKKTHLKILTGGQFNPSFASSHVGNELCQFLFKSGNEDIKGWDEFTSTSEKLRVYFGFTQLAGVVYYRMGGFIKKFQDNEKLGIEPAHDRIDYQLSEAHTQWQYRLDNRFITDDLDALIKVADMTVWQIISSKRGVPFLMAAKDLHKKPIITEVDDWLFDVPSYNIASNPFKPNSDPEWMAYKQIELSDAIIVSTQFLKDSILELFPGKTIYVIPNGIDFDIWDNLKDNKGTFYPKVEGRIRIGFTGCSNHNGDLELIKRPLKKILEEFPNVEFITYSNFEALKDLPRTIITNKWLPITHFPGEIRNWQMDIGIAPLRDNNFNRAKSNLRWIEYSALRVPTICSKVYPFENSVKHGVDGILCASSDLDWYEKLKDLIVNEEKRRSIGENAYNRVKQDFNMDTIAGRYADVLKELKWKEAISRQK